MMHDKLHAYVLKSFIIACKYDAGIFFFHFTHANSEYPIYYTYTIIKLFHNFVCTFLFIYLIRAWTLEMESVCIV